MTNVILYTYFFLPEGGVEAIGAVGDFSTVSVFVVAVLSTDVGDDLPDEKSLSFQEAVSQLDRFTSSFMTSSKSWVATISGDKRGGGSDVVFARIGSVVGREVTITSSLPDSEAVDGDFFLGFGKTLGGNFSGAETSEGETFSDGDVFSVGSSSGGFALALLPCGRATGGLNFVGRITSPCRCNFFIFSSILNVGGSSTEDLGSLDALMFRFITFS